MISAKKINTLSLKLEQEIKIYNDIMMPLNNDNEQMAFIDIDLNGNICLNILLSGKYMPSDHHFPQEWLNRTKPFTKEEIQTYFDSHFEDDE